MSSVTLVDSMGDDLRIVNAARVSMGKRKDAFDARDAKLIRYLLRNGHTSPLEHVTFTFHVEAPLFVARQWMRHRTWKFNEVSYRYTQPKLGFHAPDTWRGQSESNKQASDGEVEGQEYAATIYADALAKAQGAYERLIGLGVAREQARAVLPVSTMTEFFGTVDLHNLLHFLGLRIHPHAQQEIREPAERIVELIEPIVPETLKAWRELHD